MWSIQFNPEIGNWSPFIFWYVAINAVLCAVFTMVVVIGGIFDLRYLLRSLREEHVDESDDGRCIDPDAPQRFSEPAQSERA